MDRQDIDALLIGALYGELTPAEEARLSAHLESHPTDRGALDDLKSARQAVRESRIFEVQLEPPQAVSALLLQEAHRRAPKRVVAREEERESWFYRFTRVFMVHPAMAAAAMLVLVLGVAGTLWIKKGENFADKQMSAPAAEEQLALPAPEPTATLLAEGAAAGSAAATGAAEAAADQGAAFEADLYDGEKADKLAEKPALDRRDAKQQAPTAPAPAKKRATGVVVSTEQPAPKEMESERAKRKLEKEPLSFSGDVSNYGEAGRGATAGPKGGYVTTPGSASTTTAAPNRGMAQPPPPPATIAKDDAKPTTPTNKPADAPKAATRAPAAPKPEPAPAPAQEAKRDDASLVAWAKDQHQRARTLAQKDCVAAAKVALAVSNRAPDYYAQFMATDRALKQCQQYINDARDKDAESSAKSRAQKRVNADEPAPAPTTNK